MPTYDHTNPGTAVRSDGRISYIDASRKRFDINCRSHLQLLNIRMPWRLW